MITSDSFRWKVRRGHDRGEKNCSKPMVLRDEDEISEAGLGWHREAHRRRMVASGFCKRKRVTLENHILNKIRVDFLT